MVLAREPVLRETMVKTSQRLDIRANIYFYNIFLSEAAEEVEKAGDACVNQDNRRRGEDKNWTLGFTTCILCILLTSLAQSRSCIWLSILLRFGSVRVKAVVIPALWSVLTSCVVSVAGSLLLSTNLSFVTITTSIFRAKCRAEILDCPTHKMFKKTLTERAKQKEEEGKQGVEGDRGGGERDVVAEA